ncbi:MAG TPA: hypothetical protein VF540_03680, partial [Segetibacter sp.]
RQSGRTNNTDIIHTGYKMNDIIKGIKKALQIKVAPVGFFGDGKSDQLFNEIISRESFWRTPKQKTFADVLAQ